MAQDEQRSGKRDALTLRDSSLSIEMMFSLHTGANSRLERNNWGRRTHETSVRI